MREVEEGEMESVSVGTWAVVEEGDWEGLAVTVARAAVAVRGAVAAGDREGRELV